MKPAGYFRASRYLRMTCFDPIHPGEIYEGGSALLLFRKAMLFEVLPDDNLRHFWDNFPSNIPYHLG